MQLARLPMCFPISDFFASFQFLFFYQSIELVLGRSRLHTTLIDQFLAFSNLFSQFMLCACRLLADQSVETVQGIRDH